MVALATTVVAFLYSLVSDVAIERFPVANRLIFVAVLGVVCFFISLAVLREHDRRGWALRWSAEKLRLTLLLQRAYLERNSPLLGFTAGWINRVLDEFQVWKPSAVTVDGAYWKYCVEYLEAEDNVRAVSDTSAEISEKQSHDVNAPVSRSIMERVYLHDWGDFFEPRTLQKRVEKAVQQASKAGTVFLGHVPLRLTDTRRRPFDGFDENLGEFERVVGWNIFLMGTSIVGGFVYNEDRTRILLHVRKDERLFSVAQRNYEELKSTSVQIRADSKSEEFLGRWLSRNAIGLWTWGRKPVKERDRSYRLKYDGHIRIWIPGYEDLIGACADHVKYEIVQRIRSLGTRDNADVRVLEIGFGSGALSFQILEWMEKFNNPFEAITRRMQGAASYPGVRLRFTGVDSIGEKWVAQMNEERDLANLPPRAVTPSIFTTGTFWTEMDKVEYPTYDVICSSLVLHDLLPANPTKNHFAEFLNACQRMLRPGGRVIMADVFTAGDQDKKAWWKDQMLAGGLPVDAVNNFFQYNEEMLATLDPGEVEEWALESECHATVLSPHQVDEEAFRLSPFGILVIQW